MNKYSSGVGNLVYREILSRLNSHTDNYNTPLGSLITSRIDKYIVSYGLHRLPYAEVLFIDKDTITISFYNRDGKNVDFIYTLHKDRSNKYYTKASVYTGIHTGRYQYICEVYSVEDIFTVLFKYTGIEVL